MKVLAVAALLVALALAGCTQGTPELDPNFQPSCPNWIKNRSTAVFSGPGWFHPNGTNFDSWDTNETTPVGGGLQAWNGRPLDFIEIDFHQKRDVDGNLVLRNGTPVQQFLIVQKGILQLQAFRGDGGVPGDPLAMYDSSRGPPGDRNPASFTLSWDPRPEPYTNFTVHIDLADSDQPADPSPVFLQWSLLGPRTGNGDNSAWALRETTMYFWYRTCNADGSSADA